ncbi:MAG: zinc ribbon domain-containing protein, partial [Pseudomonadota bacterium]|nr:zinc ribbon domain-containing protein [Pseudomonadota bacterium]
QILGRGCRLHDPQWPLPPSEMNWQHPDYHGKRDCLVLDYGENIERFALDDNLTITGLVEAKLKEEDGEYFAIACPECGTENRHTAHRCIGKTFEGTRCQYRFVWKSCDACETQNSPSARYCWKCEHELIDPNAKLTSQASVAPGTPFFVNVESMSLRRHIKGDEPMLRVDYLVNDGNRSFAVSEFFKPENQNPFHRKRLRYFSELVGAHGVSVDDFLAQSDSMSAPDRLLIKREKGSKYYQIESRRRDSISVDN